MDKARMEGLFQSSQTQLHTLQAQVEELQGQVGCGFC